MDKDFLIGGTDEDFLIGNDGVILPKTSYKSRRTQQSEAIEALASKAIEIAKEAKQKQECSILQISSSESSKLVEDLCQKNPLFKKTCNEIALEKKLINLQLLAYIQDIPPKNVDDWLSDWRTLGNKINRKIAIQLISNLPISLKVDQLDTSLNDMNDEKSLEKCKFTVLLYKLSGSQLRAWEEDSCIPSDIKDYYQEFEPLAFLSEARYRLIRGLFDKCDEKAVLKRLFFRPAFAWLLSEASFCRRLFKNNLKKDNLYQNWKLYTDCLSTLAQNDHIKPKYIKVFSTSILLIDIIFDNLGREVAKQDDEFEQKYFAPYVKALKRWNARTRNGKAIAVPQFDESIPVQRPRKRKSKDL
jgi:hypothetical protein